MKPIYILLIRLTIALLVTMAVNVFLITNILALVIVLPFMFVLSFAAILWGVTKVTWMLDLPEQKKATP